MKVNDVPQDERYFTGTNIRDICYAVDDEGKYHQVASAGWEPKNEALALTWEHIKEEAEAIRKEVVAQKKSPLAYYMHLKLCSIPILADDTGIPRRIIKRHLNMEAFLRADSEYIAKYAAALNIDANDLKPEKFTHGDSF